MNAQYLSPQNLASKAVSLPHESDKLVTYLADEMKKIKISLSLSELLKTPAIKKAFMKSLDDPTPKEDIHSPGQSSSKDHAARDNNIKPKVPATVQTVETSHMTLYRDKSESPPFLLTIRMFSKNLHNCLVDLGTSTNVMPLSICNALGLHPAKSLKKVTQLDKTEVSVIGELTHIHMQLASDPRIQYYIDIQVVDIPDTYGMLISRD